MYLVLPWSQAPPIRKISWKSVLWFLIILQKDRQKYRQTDGKENITFLAEVNMLHVKVTEPALLTFVWYI